MARLDQYADWLIANQDKKGTPDFETVANAYRELRGFAPAAPAPAPIVPEPSKERTFGEAFTDVGAGLVSGAGSLLKFPGQVAKLVPGLYGVGETLEKPGEYLSELGQKFKSEGLKVREQLRSKAISEAEKEGILSEFVTAIGQTVKDPALLSTFIAEQLPQLLGPAAAVKAAKLGMAGKAASATEGLSGAAATKAAEDIGKQYAARASTAAIGTGAAMQGADIGSDTFDAAMKLLEKQRPDLSEEERRDIALSSARQAAIGAGGISLATMKIPGAKAIESRLAGMPGQGRLRSALGEAAQEAVEEGGGAFAKNVGLVQIDPTQSLTAGIGAAAGLGAIGGGTLGAVLGKAPKVELLEGQKEGETLPQYANRLAREIQAGILPPETLQPTSDVLTVPQLVSLFSSQGNLGIEKYKQTLLGMEETPEIKQALQDAESLQRQATVESIQRGMPPTKSYEQALVGDQAPTLEMPQLVALAQTGGPQALDQYIMSLSALPATPEVAAGIKQAEDLKLRVIQESIERQVKTELVDPNAILDASTLRLIGFTPSDKAFSPFQVLLGKNISDPDQVEQITKTLTAIAEDPSTNQQTTNKIAEFLANLSSYATTLPMTAEQVQEALNVQRTTVPTVESTTGAGVPVVEQPGVGATAPGVAIPEPAGLGVPGEGAGPAVSGEGVQPPPLAKPSLRQPKTVAGSSLLAVINRNGGLSEEVLPEYSSRYETSKKDEKGRPIIDWRNPVVPGSGRLFRPGGMEDFNQIAFALEENGYLEPGAVESDPAGASERAKQLIKAALFGQQVLPIAEQEQALRRQADKAAREEQRETAKMLKEEAAVLKRPEPPIPEETPAGAAMEEAVAKAFEPVAQPQNLYAALAKTRRDMKGMGFSEQEITEALAEQRRKFKEAQAKVEAPAETPVEAPAEAPAEVAAPKFAPEVQKKIDQLGVALEKIMSGYGLQGVGLKVVDGLKSEGEYANKLIQIALDMTNPVRVLRHESIHGMKELGFFTDKQWATLERMARDKWVDKYLKSSTTTYEGQDMSRYDAYMKMYGNEQAVLEEAIADAFGDFDVNKAPPGFLTSMLNRMRQFFGGLKSGFQGQGFDTAESVFRKIEEGKLKAPKEAAPAEGVKPSIRGTKEGVTAIGPKKDGTFLQRIENIRQQIGDEYVAGKINLDEFHKRWNETNDEYVDALVLQKKIDEGMPATSLAEVFPGFVSIPVGTKVLATWTDLHPNPVPATVVGTRDIRVGKEAIRLPVVDFNDGKKPRTLTREDIKEVYAPRPAKASLRGADEADLNRSLSDKRISPRFPTAVKATENVLGDVRLQPDIDTLRRNPDVFRHNIGLMSRYPNFYNIKGTPAQRAEQMINHMKDNLLWLFGKWDQSLRDRSKLWYVGGNRIAHRWSEKYGIPPEQAAAVIASLSPQKDWFQNVSLAERTLDALVLNADKKWSPEMTQVFRDRSWANKFPLRNFEGKTLKEMYVPGDAKSLVNMAAWIRAWDEATNPQTARVITPEGNFSNEVAIGKSGKPIAMRAQSFAAMVKTLQILQQTDLNAISDLIGKNHKVRSFYNNIIAPYDKNDVTIDTHAVAAALMRPLGSSDLEVYHNFGSAKPAKKDKEGNILVPAGQGTKNSALTGLYGTYAMYAEAYRRAAEEAGVLPREMQSITWEAIRGLFRPEQKQAKLKRQTDVLWNKVAKGELNADEAREQISKLVSGITDPAWAKSPAGTNESPTDSSYATELRGTGVPGGRPAESVSGAGERTAGAVSKPSLRAPQTEAFKRWTDKQIDQAVENGFSAYRAGELRAQNALFDTLPKNTIQAIQGYWQTDAALEKDDGRTRAITGQLKAASTKAFKRARDLIAAFEPEVQNDPTRLPKYLTNYGKDLGDYVESEAPGITQSRYSLRAPTTQAFKQWFGDSKVVDADGNPKVMYHGTARDITAFRPQQADAIFLSPLPDFAESFSGMSRDRMVKDIAGQLDDQADVKREIITKLVDEAIADKRLATNKNSRGLFKTTRDEHVNNFIEQPLRTTLNTVGIGDQLYDELRNRIESGENILPVYVKAENPFDFENASQVSKVVRKIKDNLIGDSLFLANGSRADIKDVSSMLKEGSWKIIEQEDTQDALKSLGFDGFYIKENGVKNLAVYSSQQIKSATGNIGAYGQRPITKEEAAGVGLTEEEAAKAQKAGDIRFSLRDASWSDERIDRLLRQYQYLQNGREKDTKAFAAFINPRDFIKATTANSGDYLRIFEEAGPLREEDLKENTQPPRLYVDEDGWKIVGHEGRHRMAGLAAENIKTAPVLVVMEGAAAARSPFKSKELSGQKFEKGQGQDVSIANLVPINWENRNKLKEEFSKPSQVKFSLRATLPADLARRIDETTKARDEATFVKRIQDAISPKSFSFYRQQLLNRYEGMSQGMRRLAERMGGEAMLADISAEAAALESDRAAGVTAAAMGVHDRVGGVPVYKKQYYIIRDMGGAKEVMPQRFDTQAQAAAVAARVKGEVREAGFTTVSNLDGKVEGLIKIFTPLAKYNDPHIYQSYQFWAGVKRGSKYVQNQSGQYVEQLFNDPKDVAHAAYLEKQYPEFVDIQKKYIAFNNELVKYMMDTGVITPEAAKEFVKHADYIPFYRQLDGEETVGPRVFQSIAGAKPPKKAKGGEAPLADFLENLIRNTQSSIQAGMKNVAAQKAVQMAMDLNEATRLNIVSSAPNVVTVLEKGKQVSYSVQDQLLINSMKSLNLPDMPFIGILAGPSNLLRNLVTKDPGFMLANLMRDSLATWTLSGTKMIPIVDTIKNFGSAIAGKSPEYAALLNAGVLGGYDYAQGVEASAKQLEKALRKEAGVKATGLKGYAQLASTPFTSLWDALEKGTQASDAATRMEVYRKTLAETGNEAEALHRSYEVMNFNRKGSSATIRVLTAAVPFLNARMQGLDVFYRAATGQLNNKDAKAIQKTFFIRAATMVALSCMYWTLTHDDDDYKKQEQETKDNNWLIPSLGVKIPIPFEVGVLFKVIPERIMALTFGTDTTKDFASSMKRQLISTFAINPIPQTALPLVEVMTNHSFFTDRPIIGQGMENVAPQYQVGPGTSQIAQAIGKAAGLSPMKVDHVVKGYTGTMGMYVADLVDAVYNTHAEAPKASKRFEQLPVIKRFALDPEARGNVTAFYEMKDSVDQTTRTVNFLERTMDVKEMGKYMKDNVRMLAMHDYILDLEKTMKELRDSRNLINSSKMDADAKRDALIRINHAEQQVTQNIQKIKQMAQ